MHEVATPYVNAHHRFPWQVLQERPCIGEYFRPEAILPPHVFTDVCEVFFGFKAANEIDVVGNSEETRVKSVCLFVYGGQRLLHVCRAQARENQW